MRWPERKLAVALLALIVAGSATAAEAGVYVRLSGSPASVAPGDTIAIDAEVTAADSAFNAFSLVVRYDSTLVTLVPTTPQQKDGPVMPSACANLFRHFTATADSVQGDVSLLCLGMSVTGPGVIYHLRFASRGVAGAARFSISAGTRFYLAGVYVNPVYGQGVTVPIGSVLAAPGPPREWGYRLDAPRPNPARAANGAAVSFTLPRAERVTLELFDPLGRRAAVSELGEQSAGPSTVRWSAPALAPGRYELRLRAGDRIVGHAAWVLLH